MANEVKLPRLGQGMESGTIVKWLKAEGERVEKGEPLFEVDTDKATQEVEAEASGVLLSIAVAAGEVPVGSDDRPDRRAGREPALEPATAGAAKPRRRPVLPHRPARPKPASAPRSTAPATRRPATSRPRRLPGVWRATKASSSEGSRVPGPTAGSSPRTSSGPGAPPRRPRHPQLPGRLRGRALAGEPPEPGEFESVPLTNIRRTIARRLGEAWQVPVFQLTVSVEMTHANTLIERSRELNPDVRVTVTDLLARVCARALVRHPEVNVQFAGEELHRFGSAHVGIAVAAPQGLVVPVIRSVERLSLVEVALRRAELVERARRGALAVADLSGGTFTISNLGMYGIEQFTAVLNPPQAAILAVGTTTDRPVAVAGEVVVRPLMTVTLTVDHRAVDGAPAADFLRTVKTFLEDPALAL